jgi:hypothetical protein
MTTIGGMTTLMTLGVLFAPGSAFAQSADARAVSKVLLDGRTFPANAVACADRGISEAAPSLHIVTGQIPERRSAFAAGDVVVLSTGVPTVSVGDRYFTRRVLRSNESGRLASGLSSVRTAGWLTVIAADDQMALGRVDYTCDVVMSGDYLEPYVEPTLPVAAAAGSPRFDQRSLVLTGVDRREVFASGDVLSIDVADGTTLTPGEAIAFYRQPRGAAPAAGAVTSPLAMIEIGEGIVLTIDGRRAQVVVKRSKTAVLRGDFAYTLDAPR